MKITMKRTMKTKLCSKDLIERMKAYDEKHKPSLSEDTEIAGAVRIGGTSDVSIITPVTDVREGPVPGPDSMLSNMLIGAINGEWDTIVFYNDLITNLLSQGESAIADIIKDINNEENIHVGQLQKALEQLSPNTISIGDGEKEAEKALQKTPADKII